MRKFDRAYFAYLIGRDDKGEGILRKDGFNTTQIQRMLKGYTPSVDNLAHIADLLGIADIGTLFPDGPVSQPLDQRPTTLDNGSPS